MAASFGWRKWQTKGGLRYQYTVSMLCNLCFWYKMREHIGAHERRQFHWQAIIPSKNVYEQASRPLDVEIK